MVPEGSKSRIMCLAFLLFHDNNGVTWGKIGSYECLRDIKKDHAIGSNVVPRSKSILESGGRWKYKVFFVNLLHKPFNLLRLETYRKSDIETFQSSVVRKNSQHVNRVHNAIGAASALSAWSKSEYCNIHSVIAQNEANLKHLMGGDNVSENCVQI
ncbi:hypothetical protein ACFE04_021314 [Oxalis oulophora]